MLKIMMDQQVPGSITLGLRARGVDVLTAFEKRVHMVAQDGENLERRFKRSG